MVVKVAKVVATMVGVAREVSGMVVRPTDSSSRAPDPLDGSNNGGVPVVHGLGSGHGNSLYAPIQPLIGLGPIL